MKTRNVPAQGHITWNIHISLSIFTAEEVLHLFFHQNYIYFYLPTYLFINFYPYFLLTNLSINSSPIYPSIYHSNFILTKLITVLISFLFTNLIIRLSIDMPNNLTVNQTIYLSEMFPYQYSKEKIL